MKRASTIVVSLILFVLTSCRDSEAPDSVVPLKVTGYPLYKFLNFGGISEENLKSHDSELREALGEFYEGYIENQRAMAAAGFDRHQLLRVTPQLAEDDAEIRVYIRAEDFRSLWELSLIHI